MGSGTHGPYRQVQEDQLAVASTGTAYTKSVALGHGAQFAIWLNVTSGGTVDVSVTLEQSWRAPTTEGSSDTSYVLPEGVTEIINPVATGAACAGYTPIALPYARFLLTGQGSNAASTKVDYKIYQLDEL